MRTVDAIAKVGYEKTSQRQLWMATVDEFADISALSFSPLGHFVCLIAADASSASVEGIYDASACLLDAGVSYICCWGPDCELVHDIFEEAEVGPNPAPETESVVMSTWHTNESLDSALWFAVYSTIPDEPYQNSTSDMIAIVVGNGDWGRKIYSRLSDPKRFNTDVLAPE